MSDFHEGQGVGGPSGDRHNVRARNTRSVVALKQRTPEHAQRKEIEFTRETSPLSSDGIVSKFGPPRISQFTIFYYIPSGYLT
jgi:hypothetical protein